MEEPYELLVHCASQGDISQLDAVLTNHKDALDVNFQTDGGLNLLMQAVISAGSNVNPKGRYLDVVKVLIRAGISLAVADITYGRTVLHWTVHYDREDILTELLAADSEDLCKIPDFSGLSPFHLAIQSNSIKCFEVFLTHLPADILEYPDTQGRKPLTLSIIEGNLEAFVLLLNAGVDVIDNDPSPLHLSAQCGQTEMLELLLKLVQVNPGETNNDGQTIAHIAAAQSSPEMIQVVARYRPELLQSPDNRGITPLMYACGYGIDTNVKVLIKKKVPLDIGDNERKTGVHWASESQAVKASKCIQLLCKALPSLIELTDQQRRTPFHIAAISGNSNNLEMLVNLGCNVQAEDDNNCTALHWAAASGQFECIAALVKLGIPVDCQNIQGVLPVHFAASSGNEDSLKYLLEAGCDIESKDDNQRTPVHWAVQDSGSIKCLQLLIMLGANFNETDAEGLNALHMACRNDNLAACQYLIETARCNGNAVDPKGQTALFHALEAVSLGCMEFLLSRGSNCNHQNNEGRSLAHLAASIGSLETLLLLAQYGADFELQTPKGIKPIHDAAANGQTDVLEYLALVGCDIFAQTLDGSTILHYSAVKGYSTCVKMILNSNFDPNVVLTTEEGDKLTPLDCAEAYEHLETAAVIKSAGGKNYKSFATEIKENITTTTTDDKASESIKIFADENSACDQQLPDFKIHDNQTDNQIHVEFQLVNSAQHNSEEEVKPLSSVTDQSMSSNESRPVTSRLADATTTDSEAKNNQASEIGTMQDIRCQNDQTVPLSSTYQTANRPGPLASKTSKVKSNSSLFAKAISFIKGEEKKPSIVSSSVALYGAQATILAGAIIGSPLGNKAMEIGEKVAKNVAEDIKEVSHLSQTLPALLWEESVSPTPSPTPTPPFTPSPEPVKPPSPVEVNTDLYEKRIRKARAQLDEMKTPAFLAIQELLKAEATHVKLMKQFEFARLEEHLEKIRAEHKLNEIKAEQESQKLLEKQNQKIGRIHATSEAIHSKIDKMLGTATTQNAMLHFTLRTLGISPNPTVSEWIKQKQEQRKENLQSTLISWDVQKLKREGSIKMKQLLTSERAIKHAAWDSEKNIQQKIKSTRDRRIPSICYTPMHSPSPTSTGRFKHHNKRSTTLSESKKDKPRHDSMKCSSNVQFTPTGLRKVSIEGSSSTHHKMNQLWKLGSSVAQGNLSSTKVLLDKPTLPVRMRATGPKTYHIGRTLMFVSPDKYKRPDLLLKNKSLQQNTNLETNHTVQYHSHTKDVFII